MSDQPNIIDVHTAADVIGRGERAMSCEKLAMTFLQLAQDGNNLDGLQRSELG